jgi:hypothetical protein
MVMPGFVARPKPAAPASSDVMIDFSTEKGSNAQLRTFPMTSRHAGAKRWPAMCQDPQTTSSFLQSTAELEERNARGGLINIASTVTICKFNRAGKLSNLDVYVAHIGRR